MVANSDIQIWQDAVKGINESGKTDLTQEEWSALTVLNGSLSSGDFSSDESRRSYQVLNDNLKSHDNNSVLHTHLYNFIALCYRYATVQQSSATQVTPTTLENPPMPKENKQSGTIKNILFGVDGQFKQTLSKNLKFAIISLLVTIILAGIIYALSVVPYTNMPGYITALVIGTLVSISLLRKNQNGKIREKLAFLGAAAAGIYMYFRFGEQISGSSAFVWTFLGVGLVLSFIGRNKPKLPVWLAEVIPATLCFFVFERLGGAISGFGAKDVVLGHLVSVRYVEAFKIFLWFCLFQSFANNAIAAQCRERAHSQWRNLLFYGMQMAVVLLLLCVSINPFKLPIFNSVKSELIAFSQPVRADADVFDATGNKLGSATKTPINSALLSEHIPGYLATAYDFHYDGGFDTARITFRYDDGLGIISENFQPRIYYFNESDGTLEELPNQEVQTNYGKDWASVSAKTTHFSTYILLNSVEYNKIWTAEIRRPTEADLCSCGSSFAVPTTTVNFDVVFVIDESGSMQQNDHNNLRVEAAKQFTDMLATDSPKNRAAIYGFETSERKILNLTTLNNKEAVKASLNSIHSGGGTNIYSGLQAAVQEIEAYNDCYTPVIILMTDGQDNSTLTNYTPLIDRANAKKITVFAIGLGKDVNSTLLRQICDNTGGGVYYYAENSDVLPSIFKSANTAIIDYVKDSNGDGISDYYAQLLNDGTLRLSNGSGQFKGIDWVNCPADLDGDGLLNGEELVITGKIMNGAMQVFVNMKSDPTDKNSTGNITNFSAKVNEILNCTQKYFNTNLLEKYKVLAETEQYYRDIEYGTKGKNNPLDISSYVNVWYQDKISFENAYYSLFSSDDINPATHDFAELLIETAVKGRVDVIGDVSDIKKWFNVIDAIELRSMLTDPAFLKKCGKVSDKKIREILNAARGAKNLSPELEDLYFKFGKNYLKGSYSEDYIHKKTLINMDIKLDTFEDFSKLSDEFFKVGLSSVVLEMISFLVDQWSLERMLEKSQKNYEQYRDPMNFFFETAYKDSKYSDWTPVSTTDRSKIVDWAMPKAWETISKNYDKLKDSDSKTKFITANVDMYTKMVPIIGLSDLLFSAYSLFKSIDKEKLEMGEIVNYALRLNELENKLIETIKVKNQSDEVITSCLKIISLIEKKQAENRRIMDGDGYSKTLLPLADYYCISENITKWVSEAEKLSAK